MPYLLSLPLRIARGTIELEVRLARATYGLARGIVAPGSGRRARKAWVGVPSPAPEATTPEPALTPPAEPMDEPPRPHGDALNGARRARGRVTPSRRRRRRGGEEPVVSVGPSAHAGAEVHVDAPWEGYDEMSLQEVLARLRDADEAAVAVVRLYESQHENRQAILLATGGEP